VICVDGKAALKAGAAAVFLLPSEGLFDYRERSGGAADGDGVDEELSRARCIRGAAGLRPAEGLLLMTNDGALAQKLMKAGSHAPKTYL